MIDNSETGIRLALSYSLSSYNQSQAKIKKLEYLLVKERIKNQQHVEHIHRLQNTIQLMSQEVREIRQQTDQQNVRHNLQSILREDRVCIINKLNRLGIDMILPQSVENIQQINVSLQNQLQDYKKLVLESLDCIKQKIQEILEKQAKQKSTFTIQHEPIQQLGYDYSAQKLMNLYNQRANPNRNNRHTENMHQILLEAANSLQMISEEFLELV